VALGGVLPLLAGVVSAVFAAFVGRHYLRARRPFQLAWFAGLAAYALASFADAIAIGRGWSPALYWGYLLLASGNVGLLGLGTAYLLRSKTLGHAFAAFVALCLLTMLAAALVVKPLPSLASAGAEVGLDAVPKVGLGEAARVAFILLSAVGGLALIGGALWSGWQTRRPGVLLIGVGSLVVAAGGSAQDLATRFGSGVLTATDARLLTQLLGIAIMFAGYLQGREARGKPGAPRADATEA
jgi:hypothetical protein